MGETSDKTIIFGRYQVLRRLATGGMAEVFLARAMAVEGFQREVVVKRILPEYSQNADFVSSFLDEAKLTAQLVHPHIAQVFDLGQVGESYFLAMEYVKGYDLGIIATREREEKSRVPVPIALRVMIDLCEGLEYAHQAANLDGEPLNIIHRDITPSNVLVSFDGIAKIVDFGIAKASASSNDRRTATGTVKGKVSYLSPEQVMGRALDRRVDVFAAGIVLYELLAGKNPFRTDTDFGTLRNIIESEPEPPSHFGAPQALDAVMKRVLAKSPDDRYSSIADLLHDLEQVAARSSIALSHGEVARYLRAHRPALDALSARIAGGGGDLESSFSPEETISVMSPDAVKAPELMPRRVPSRSRIYVILGAAVLVSLVLLLSVLLARKPQAPIAPAQAPAVATASVSVTSSPTGMSVIIDGVAVGLTPLIRHGYPLQSRHVVECLAGAETVSRTLVDTSEAMRYDVHCAAAAPKEPVAALPAKAPEAKNGRRSSAKATAAPQPTGSGTGKLRIIAKPSGAEVSVDGKHVGETPFPPVEVRVGSHVVVIDHADLHKRESRRVEIVADKETLLEIDLNH